MRPRPAGVVAAIVLTALALSSAASGGESVAPTRVTVFGDSAATAMAYDPSARRTLGRGIDLELELAACRRVGDSSCPYDGVRPPNVIERATALGSSLGPVVVVIVGYNDYEANYAENIEQALAVFRTAGVQRVLWATLRESRQSYASMNDMIRDAARRHPEVTVVDWNAASHTNPGWFQPDEIHLTPTGAEAMAEPRERHARRARHRPEGTGAGRAEAPRDPVHHAAQGRAGSLVHGGSEGHGRHDAVPLESDRRRAPARCSARVDGTLDGRAGPFRGLHASRAGRRPRRRLAYACRDGPDRVASAAPAQAKEVQVTLNAFQRELCESSPYDFTGLRALYVNCTLKRSPEVSNTQGLIDVSVAIMEANGVSVDEFRAVDHDLAPGVYPDMREHGAATDAWPDLYERVQAADVLVLARRSGWARSPPSARG